jgi:hypothetical protein
MVPAPMCHAVIVMPKCTGTRINRPDKGLDAVQNARRVVLESVGDTEAVAVSVGLVSQVMAAMATLNNNLYKWSPPTDWRTQVRGKSV